jgi:WD40 repeat protein/ankyrin repeat protein
MSIHAGPRQGEIVAGRYRILDVLGRGGNAELFLVEDMESGRQLALKELLLGKAADWKVVELFEREARVLAGLTHPAIPRYVAYHQIDGARGPSFCLVQELAPGRPLTQWLDEGWRPDEAAAKQIAEQVLVVLGYLHALQPPVIHRDLKPQNLIRAEDGTIRVVDFGAVQAAIRDAETGGSTIVGTYGFMAPEQSRGVASPATDLFGLGATLLFLVTRKTLADFPHKDLRVDFRKSVNVSPAFAGWLEQMLEPDPARRFPSAAAARRALVTGVIPRPSSARRPWILGGAAAGIAVLALGMPRIWELRNSRRAGEAAQEQVAQVRWLTWIPAHFSAVFAADLSPDQQTIASGSRDGTVKLWNANSGAAIAALAGHEGTVGAVQFSPDNKTLYTGDAAAVHAWDLGTRTQRFRLAQPEQVTSIAVSADGKRLVSGSFDGTVRLWEAASGKPFLTLTHYRGTVRARVLTVAFSPDGSKVVSGGGDGMIRVWNANNGTSLRALSGHNGDVDKVAFAADGQTVASVGDDRTLRLWSMNNGGQLYERPITRGQIWALALSPDSSTVVTGGQDGTIRLWNLMTGKLMRAFSDQTRGRGTLSLAFARDGQVLVSGGGDGVIKTWEVGEKEEKASTGVATTVGDEDAAERTGWQPLHVAAWEGDREGVKKLLAEHANVDERNAYGRTPLYLAAKRGHLEVVKLLAARGANVDAPARYEMTPLWVAVQNGNDEVVAWLLEHGANPTHLTDIRQSPLYKAAEQGRLESAKLLLAKKVPLNDADRAGFAPLGIAAKNGHADVVELLAAQPGIDLNCRNGPNDRMTPLQMAAYYGHASVVKVLTARGADVNDRGGAREEPPLQLARARGYAAIADMLSAAGAK